MYNVSLAELDEFIEDYFIVASEESEESDER